MKWQWQAHYYQESCPLGLTRPPGGTTDDHATALCRRSAGISRIRRIRPPNRESMAGIARDTGITALTSDAVGVLKLNHRQPGVASLRTRRVPLPVEGVDRRATRF
jgi:hypothetical protein